MGTKFNQIIPAHDVEDQPGGEVATWFNSVTDCFIMTQEDSVGAVEQISIYPPQMRELRDLLNKALGEDKPLQLDVSQIEQELIDKIMEQAGAYGQQYKVGSPGWHKWKSTLMFLSVYKSPEKEQQDD